MSAPAPVRRRRPSWRLGWMLPAGLALLAGLDAALLLLDLPAPVTTSRLPLVHGMIMVLGFVGTLVALERATALDRWFGFLAPALLGLGAITLLAEPLPLVVGQSLLVAGSAAFTLVYLPLWRRQHDHAVLTQMLGAGLAGVGAMLWLGGAPFDRVVSWLMGFVVLTIAAERVELARITLGPRAGARVLAHAGSIVAALVIGLWFPHMGAIALGLALGGLVAWLLVHDVARRTIRGTGVTRFMAAAILAGYVWLTVAAVTLLLGHPRGYGYDAVLHAVFLGYTISMIMAHATTILPAVLRIDLPYRSAFWIPLVVLQVSLVVRLGVGDALGWVPAWRVGGVLGIIALLLFLATALTSAILGPMRRPHPPGQRPVPAAARGGAESRGAAVPFAVASEPATASGAIPVSTPPPTTVPLPVTGSPPGPGQRHRARGPEADGPEPPSMDCSRSP